MSSGTWRNAKDINENNSCRHECFITVEFRVVVFFLFLHGIFMCLQINSMRLIMRCVENIVNYRAPLN